MWQQVKREYKIEDSLYAEATASHPEKKKARHVPTMSQPPHPQSKSYRKPDKTHSTGARIPEKQTTFITCDKKEESSPDSHWSQIIGSSMFGRESIRVTEADPSNRTAGE